MPRETVPVGTNIEVRFASGTTLTGIAGAAAATQYTPAPGTLRSATLPSEIDTSPEFERALREVGLHEQETIHLDMPAAASRLRGRTAVDRIVLRPAVSAGDTAPRVVLYQDESGGLSWHFSAQQLLSEEERNRARRRGFRLDPGATSEFRIPLRSMPARRAMDPGLPRRSLRGPITKIGRKILKVLVVPLADAIGNPIQDIASVVERRYRRNLIWQVTSENFRRTPTAPFENWSSLRGKRSLLVVHGILSTAEAMLASLP